MFPFFLFCQKAPSNEAAVDKASGRRWKADSDDKMKQTKAPSKCTNCFELQKWPSLNAALLCVIFFPLYSFSVFKMILVSQGRSLLLKPSVSGKGNGSQADNLFLSHPKSTTHHHLLSQRYVYLFIVFQYLKYPTWNLIICGPVCKMCHACSVFSFE